jgi:MarR family 2-MHQ and catechol resistance regulon transcriptional repressor
VKLQELAEAVRHSQSGTTRLVDRMEKEGLVLRHACDEDRRVTWALLSKKGEETYQQAVPVWEVFLNDHLRKGLTAEEAEMLRTLLLKLQGTLSPGAQTCPSLVVSS